MVYMQWCVVMSRVLAQAIGWASSRQSAATAQGVGQAAGLGIFPADQPVFWHVQIKMEHAYSLWPTINS